MAGRRVHFVMPDELVDRIDAALAEGQSRGEFVRRAVERALDESGDGPPATGDEAMSRKPSTGTVKPPAPAEPPVEQPPKPRPFNGEDVRLSTGGSGFDSPSRRHAETCKCPVCSS